MGLLKKAREKARFTHPHPSRVSERWCRISSIHSTLVSTHFFLFGARGSMPLPATPSRPDASSCCAKTKARNVWFCGSDLAFQEKPSGSTAWKYAKTSMYVYLSIFHKEIHDHTLNGLDVSAIGVTTALGPRKKGGVR